VTVLLFVLGALIVFLAGVFVYSMQFHMIGGKPQTHVQFWRPEYRLYYTEHNPVNKVHTIFDVPRPVSDSTPAVTKPVNNDETVNILVMGLDEEPFNTDVIMIANFNTGEGSLNILQIPRDTLYCRDGSRARINTLMKSKYNMELKANPPKSKGDYAVLRQKAMKATVDSLEGSLGIGIDGYALIDLEGFRKVIDIIGGVPINVPYAMRYEDPEQNLSINLKAGQQTLSGAQAEMFVRYRAGYAQGDLGRVNAQKIFLTALFARLRDKAAGEIPELINTAINHVTTDFGVTSIIKLATKFLGIDMAKIRMMTLPGIAGEYTSPYYVMNRAATLEIINSYFLSSSDRAVTESVFDVKRVFTQNSKSYSAIYNADKEAYTAIIENAQSISENNMINKPS